MRGDQSSRSNHERKKKQKTDTEVTQMYGMYLQGLLKSSWPNERDLILKEIKKKIKN